MKKFIILFPFFLFSAPINNTFEVKNFNVNSYFFSDFGYANDLFFNSRYKHYIKKNGKNIAVLFSRIYTGIKKNKYSIGIFKQENFLLFSNKDSAEFVFQLLNKKVLEKNKTYNIFIKLKGFETQGIYINKIININNDLKISLSSDIYNISFMQDGIVRGYGYIENKNNYHYYAHANYFYSKNFLYKIHVKYHNGYGENIHFGIKYHKKDFICRILLNNIFSYVKINQVPYSDVYLNSNNKHYKKGYLSYSPIFYGKEYYRNYDGAFNKKFDIFIMKKFFYIEYFKLRKLKLKYIGIKKKNYCFNYEFRNRTIGFQLNKKKYFFNIETDNLNYKKAKNIALNAGVNFIF